MKGKSQYYKQEYDSFRAHHFYIQEANLDMDFVPHTHDFDEIVLITGGTGAHIMGGQTYPLRRGDVFVIRGSAEHGFCNVCALSMVNVMYDSRILLENSADLRALPGFAGLFIVQPALGMQADYPYMLFLEEDELENVLLLCRYLSHQLSSDAAPARLRAQYGFKTLAADLAGHFDSTGTFSPQMRIFADAIAYMKCHMDETVSLENMAQAASVSPRHLERIFLNFADSTPMEYLRNMRLEYARVLLHNTDRSVAEIAFSAGFSDPAYFGRVYRKRYGAAPGSIRGTEF